MAALSAERRREIREIQERLRRLEEMPPQSIVFCPPDWMALAEALDALETAEAKLSGNWYETELRHLREMAEAAEAELRLAQELLRRVESDMCEAEVWTEAHSAIVAYFAEDETVSPGGPSLDELAALAAIRREVEGRDG